MKTKIILRSFPHRKRWMKGTVVKESFSSEEIKNISWKDEIKNIIQQWFVSYYDVACTLSDIKFIYSLSSSTAEKRVELFLHNVWLYDIRIIHLRMHKDIESAFIKLKISFKRQHKK